MKRRTGVMVILLICTGCWMVSAENSGVPDLMGNWTGTSAGHYAPPDGYVGEGDFQYVLAVTGQKDRAFNGTLFESGIHGEKTYNFSGVISHDMKTLNMADHDKGYNSGYLLTSDTMELILLVDGSKALAEICNLKKI